jgi:DNA-binding MarR family transcriptional regulator
MTNDKGFRYVYTKEQAQEYGRLKPEQRLEWLEKMARFFYYFTPEKNKQFGERLRRGEI